MKRPEIIELLNLRQHTYSEIARLVGVSRQRVSVIAKESNIPPVAKQVILCPKDHQMTKNGIDSYSGKQRYYCKECGKDYINLTRAYLGEEEYKELMTVVDALVNQEQRKTKRRYNKK